MSITKVNPFEGGGGGKALAQDVFLTFFHNVRVFNDREDSLDLHKRTDDIAWSCFEPRGLKWQYNARRVPIGNWYISGRVPPIHDPPIIGRRKE